jgi:hypothetical protein
MAAAPTFRETPCNYTPPDLYFLRRLIELSDLAAKPKPSEEELKKLDWFSEIFPIGYPDVTVPEERWELHQQLEDAISRYEERHPGSLEQLQMVKKFEAGNPEESFSPVDRSLLVQFYQLEGVVNSRDELWKLYQQWLGFWPKLEEPGDHLELCETYLSEGGCIKKLVHRLAVLKKIKPIRQLCTDGYDSADWYSDLDAYDADQWNDYNGPHWHHNAIAEGLAYGGWTEKLPCWLAKFRPNPYLGGTTSISLDSIRRGAKAGGQLNILEMYPSE